MNDIDVLYPPIDMQDLVYHYASEHKTDGFLVIDHTMNLWAPQMILCQADCITPFILTLSSLGKYITREVKVLNSY